MIFRVFVCSLIFSASLLSSVDSFGNNPGGNDWWKFLNEKYHFNIDKNFDIYHESTAAYSINYLDIEFDNNTELLPDSLAKEVTLTKDFVIKYEKKEINGDIINYTNALLIKKGEHSHSACRAKQIKINKSSKKITAKNCTFSKLFDDTSNNNEFSGKTKFNWIN